MCFAFVELHKSYLQFEIILSQIRKCSTNICLSVTEAEHVDLVVDVRD